MNTHLVGTDVNRIDGPAKVSGAAKYAGETLICSTRIVEADGHEIVLIRMRNHDTQARRSLVSLLVESTLGKNS